MSHSIRNEDLKVGDIMLLWCGAKRITSIEPYKGPLEGVIFATVTYTPGVKKSHGGLSLECGGYTEIEERSP